MERTDNLMGSDIEKLISQKQVIETKRLTLSPVAQVYWQMTHGDPCPYFIIEVENRKIRLIQKEIMILIETLHSYSRYLTHPFGKKYIEL